MFCQLRKLAWCICDFAAVILLCLGSAMAQYGNAPNNYYPDEYSGTTFTGVVEQTTNETITLTYSHGKKTQTFEGRIVAPCNLPVSPSATRPVPATAIQKGWLVTAYFDPKAVKVDGKKENVNEIIAVSILGVNGRTVKSEHQAIFYCLPGSFHTTFKASQ